MRIDKTLLEDGITPELLYQLISRHQHQTDRFRRLEDYYLGRHKILRRPKVSEGAANNRIVANHARYITDVTTAYLISTPVTYSASDGYDIEPVKDCYYRQAIANLDLELEKNRSICGRAYEIVYVDQDAQPKSCIVPVHNAIVVYDDTAAGEKLLGIHFYNHRKLDGTLGPAEAVVMDQEYAYRFASKDSSFSAMSLAETIPHYFGAVPMIEYKNNMERQGDFEQQLSLIDAYNMLLSDRVNDKEQFVDAFLLLLGIDIDSDQARKLKREKILMGESDGKAEYLSKVLTESDIEVLRSALKEDIHRFSMVPDLSDEEFAGNLSGVAIRYKLLGFEQHVKNKERLFETGLKERFALYNQFLHVKRNMPLIPVHRIDVEFKRNLPSNELEIAQMINYLIGFASDETLLSRLPFVTDAKEEAELAKKEKAEKQAEMVKKTDQLQSYGKFEE